jgi:hypothetical protein
MIFQSLKEFSTLQNILSKVNDDNYKEDIDKILDDPEALASIFIFANYLNIDLPYNDIRNLNLTNESEKEFIKYYLIGLSIVIMELKTHNCCNIQHKFMRLYKHALVESAKTNDFRFIDSVLDS